MELHVDGTPVNVRDTGSLLEALRDDLDLTCVKDGCAPQGQCGACSVLIDGTPRLACVTPVARAAGRTVTTSAGLTEPLRSRLATAFCHEGAFVCGFCTPGILVRAHALLTEEPDADSDRIRRALAANLCRCTGWAPVVDAIAASAGTEPDPSATAPAFGGATHRGVDVPTGAHRFLADRRDVEVWAVPVCAGANRGRLLGVDFADGAEVVTAAEAGAAGAARQLLVAAGDEIRDAGEVVALALGATLSQARAVATGCRVRLDTEVGSVPDGDAASPAELGSGWSFVASDPAFLEPEAALAQMDATAGRLEVVTQSETVPAEERFLAALWPELEIQLDVDTNAGAFGAKSGPGPGAFAALVSALTGGRRTAVVFGRSESILWHPRRLPGVAEVDLGLDDAAPGGVAHIDGHVRFAGGGAECGPNPYVTRTTVLTSTLPGRKGGWPGVAPGGRLRGDGELVWAPARDRALVAAGIDRRALCAPAAAAAWDAVLAEVDAPDAVAVAGSADAAVAAAVRLGADAAIAEVVLAWAGAAATEACRLEAVSGAFMGLGAALSEEVALRDGVPTPATIRSLGLLRAAATPPIVAVAAPDAGGGAAPDVVGARAAVATAVAVALAADACVPADHAVDGAADGRTQPLPMRDAAPARLARRR